MLRFEQLKINNFGPFKGGQELNFGDKDGVTIIWGDNGQGKTTLLNVFRYALYGYIKDRRGTSSDYINLSNIESVEEGIYGFSIVLKMSNGSDKYILTRDVHPREGVLRPNTNEDFIEDCFLKKNGNILSVSDREHELALIMPTDISRFFLFDGELLQEYEALLDDNSNDGVLIKTSIEKILGMPILTNSAKDISELVSEYITAKNKVAQNDKNTSEYAHTMETLIDQIEGHKLEADRLEELLEKEVDKLEVVKKKMSDTEKLRNLLSNEAVEIQAIASSKKRRDEIKADINVKMKNAWQGMLQPVISSMVIDSRNKLEEYNKRKAMVQASQTTIREIEYAIKLHECRICERKVSDELETYLRKKSESIKAETMFLSDEEKNELNSLQIRLNAFQSLNLQNDGPLITSKIEDLNKAEIEITDAEGHLSDIKKELKTYGDYDPDTPKLANDYSICQVRIAELKNGIKEEKKAITEAIITRDKLDKKISSLSKNKDVLAANERLTLCQDIERVFALGINQYRNSLKCNVEADASKLFTKMSLDQDYEKLQIDDNYGLEIIHKKGIKVPNRSAGFEHVVALSLIGALHKNAPLQGPVIMDSPFGRLGIKHKENVTVNLPALSGQVILLVYDGEIDPAKSRELLGGNLLKEYRLERVSSFHKRIC